MDLDELEDYGEYLEEELENCDEDDVEGNPNPNPGRRRK